jgi:2-iminoacetate synthase ThiH
MEAMSVISVDEAQGILDSHDLITIGARADEERRRRHGRRTTFLRVLEVKADAVPVTWPASVDAGELRITGQPASLEAAVAAVTRAASIAKSVPLSAFSLMAVWSLATASMTRFRDVLAALKAAGLHRIAEATIDTVPEPSALIGAAHDAGLHVSRLTIHELPSDRRVDLLRLAREIQSEVGGVQVFAPLPRVWASAQPSTGYDDVKQISIARLLVDNIESIQVDWSLYGPKLAQVALTMGADDVDGVSPLEGDLGRRRSPIEEIRGNIKAAGLEPIERDGGFGVRE